MDSTGAFAEVNDSIRDLATDGPATQTWDFFCECPDTACHSLVSLTLIEFDEYRATVTPVVAEHHAAA